MWTRTKVPPPPPGPQTQASSEGETGRRQEEEAEGWGPDIRPFRHPTPQTGELRSALPASPLPEARGAGGPTSTSRPSSSAATPPSRRPMAPARTVRSLAARRAQGRSAPRMGKRTPGIRAYAGRRMRAKPAELQEVPGRPRRAPPIHLTGARSRAPSLQSLWSALRDAVTAGLGEKTAWCLLSRRKPSCLTTIVLGRFLKDTGLGSWG